MGMGAGCGGCANKGSTPEDGPVSHKKKTRYTVAQFISDSLVPVEGYAAWTPLDRRRIKELQNQLNKLNKIGTGGVAYRESFSSFTQTKRDELPPEVICFVTLTRAEIASDIDDAFDFNQESRLDVALMGELHFPPQSAKEAIRQKEKGGTRVSNAKDGDHSILDHWTIGVKVFCLLEREQNVNPDDDDDNEATHLKVTCLDMQVLPEQDTMVSSWLPQNDILKHIEDMLASNLSNATRVFDSSSVC